MRHALMMSVFCLSALLAFGCGDYANKLKGPTDPPRANGPNPNNLPNPNNVPKPGAVPGYTVNHSPVVLSELLVNPTGPEAGNQYVELLNTGGLDSDIGGWVLTDGNATFTFPFGFRIAASSRVVVRLGMAGAASANLLFAPSFGTLYTHQGAIALLRGGSEVVDYLQWGGSPNSYENAAVQAQAWPAGDFVVPGQEGESFNFIGGVPGSSAWRSGVATPGN